MFYTLILFPMHLISSTFQNGINSYRDGDYQKAYQLFQDSFLEDIDNPKISFYIGLSAFKLKLYDESVIAFQRVLLLDENHIRSELELGRVYIVVGNYKEAEKRLKRVLESNPPDSVRKNVERLLESIDNRDTFNLHFALGGGFETNINASPETEELRDYLSEQYSSFNREGFRVQKKSSPFHNQSLDFIHNLDFGERGGFHLQNSLNIFNQSYTEESDYNILYLGATSGVSYIDRNSRLSLSGSADKIYYGDSPLLHSYSLIADYSYLYFNMHIKHRWKNYKNSDRDSIQDEVILSLSKGFGKNLFQASISRIVEDSLNKYRFVDKSENGVRLIYKRILPYSISGTIQFFKRFIDYKEDRDDRYSSYLLSISKAIGKDLSLDLTYNYIENSSNYIPVKYNKSLYSFGLGYKF